MVRSPATNNSALVTMVEAAGKLKRMVEPLGAVVTASAKEPGPAAAVVMTSSVTGGLVVTVTPAPVLTVLVENPAGTSNKLAPPYVSEPAATSTFEPGPKAFDR